MLFISAGIPCLYKHKENKTQWTEHENTLDAKYVFLVLFLNYVHLHFTMFIQSLAITVTKSNSTFINTIIWLHILFELY